MNRKVFLQMEIAGCFFVFIIATLLHFSYELSSGAMWSILIGAVNESVWEHIKIFTMPFIFWSAVEFAIIKPAFKKFVIVKVICLYTLAFSIIILFYSYISIVGHSILFIDISIAIVSIIICYILSYKLIKNKSFSIKNFFIAVFALALFISMYVSFTVAPPHIELFRDPKTNEFGIPNTYINENRIILNEKNL